MTLKFEQCSNFRVITVNWLRYFKKMTTMVCQRFMMELLTFRRLEQAETVEIIGSSQRILVVRGHKGNSKNKKKNIRISVRFGIIMV